METVYVVFYKSTNNSVDDYGIHEISGCVGIFETVEKAYIVKTELVRNSGHIINKLRDIIAKINDAIEEIEDEAYGEYRDGKISCSNYIDIVERGKRDYILNNLTDEEKDVYRKYSNLIDTNCPNNIWSFEFFMKPIRISEIGTEIISNSEYHCD